MPPAFSIGDALSWAWNKFTQNAAALIVPTLAYFVGIGILYGINIAANVALSENTTTTYTDPYSGTTSSHVVSTPSPAALIVGLVVDVLLVAVAWYMQAAFVSGTLDIADGKPVAIGTFFKPRNLGGFILTLLLVSIGVFLGLVLCIVPGLIFGFLAMFAAQYVVDRSLSPIDAIKASIATVRANIVPGLLYVVVAIAAVAVNFVTCGFGTLVTAPVLALVLTYTYRKLTGGQIAEVGQPGFPQGPPPGIPPGPPPQYS
ncbi:MAG: hypothetical protein QOH91_2669 [Mycobacterium sp.]|nr:hypothetical protein [Mycobacterium sp.]